MKILTRQVTIPKSAEEVTRILKTCAYYLPKALFDETAFSMFCAKRHNGGYLSLTQIRGQIFEDEDSAMVILDVHANINFIFGCVIAFLGIIGLLCYFLSYMNRWIPLLGMILLGLLVSAQSLWEGLELLDLIEHKLTR